jgi:hypothetical protein
MGAGTEHSCGARGRKPSAGARHARAGRRPYAMLSVLTTLGYLLIIDRSDVGGQELRTTSLLAPERVKHVLTASIIAAPGHARSKDSKATLRVVVRISDHALDSRFYGDVAAFFSDLPLIGPASEQKVWEDKVCHQQRGLPKVAVVAINGSLRGSDKDISISARIRQIGKLVPDDEISAGVPLPGGTDQIGQFRVIHSETKQSRVAVRLKLYALGCDGVR